MAQEAQRLACVGVISGYALAHAFVPLVVCPRAVEYRALPAVSRLRLVWLRRERLAEVIEEVPIPALLALFPTSVTAHGARVCHSGLA